MIKTVSTVFLWQLAFLVRAQDQNPFGWLGGKWSIRTNKGTITESWNMQNDSTSKASSYFINAKGDSIPQETVMLSQTSGTWYYSPAVNNQNEGKPVPFMILYMDTREFIAVNTEHDFPQRISYRRIGDSLYASIEGTRNGKYEKQNFDFSLER